jgi:intracellular sulfur oxidation DsrE/DsrF family protein
MDMKLVNYFNDEEVRITVMVNGGVAQIMAESRDAEPVVIAELAKSGYNSFALTVTDRHEGLRVKEIRRAAVQDVAA